MMPIGPLMIEHRLIERMIAQLRAAMTAGEAGRRFDLAFLDIAVDFARTYADRCHHGKEEQILFRDLAGRPLSAELRETMNELVEEHVYGRRCVGELAAAKDAYMSGLGPMKDLIGAIRRIVEFYPAHIEKEDKRFFFPVMEYLTGEQKERMLAEFNEFDRRLIHEKYEQSVEAAEKSAAK